MKQLTVFDPYVILMANYERREEMLQLYENIQNAKCFLMNNPDLLDNLDGETVNILTERTGINLTWREWQDIMILHLGLDLDFILYTADNEGIPSVWYIILDVLGIDYQECVVCRKIYTSGIHEVGGDLVCQACLEDYYSCRNCGRIHHPEDMYEAVDGNLYCEDCQVDMYDCTHCEGLIPPNGEQYDANGEIYCSACADDYLVTCDCCNEVYHEEDTFYREDITLCNNCQEYYYICDNCDCWVHEDDVYYDDYNDNRYCSSCWDDHSNQAINAWDFKPRPEYKGGGICDRLTGVEIEIDKGGRDHYVAEYVTDVMGYVYCKHDGSLNNGFEIVTHPATLDYHLDAGWESMFSHLASQGYRSHDTDTCGLHVHMNRKAFGSSTEEQETAIMKILYFFEKNWQNIVQFSRRTQSNLDQWARRYLSSGEEVPEPKKLLDYAKGDYGRYRSVNLQNYNTIEIRVFRGTLNYQTFVATLQFVELLFDLTELTLEETLDFTWDDFKEMGSKYEEFTSYMNKRGL